VARLEADLAQAAMTEVPAAFMKVMAADGRVVGSRAAPDNSPAGQAAELQRRPRSIAFRPLGGEASAAGDLVWTYGEARWTEAAGPRRGHYARIWQRRAGGWVLLFDELLAVPAR